MSDPNKEHFLNPRPSTGQYQLPVGVHVDGALVNSILVREMTGVEEELLAARGDVLTRLNQVMANCLLKLGDKDVAGSVSVVNSMTVVDRFYLLIAIRRASLGDDYMVEAKCPSCGHEGKYNIDLDNLDISAPEDAEGVTIKDGHHVLTTPSGLEVSFHPMLGSDEVWLSKVVDKLKGEAPVTLNMLSRIDALNGHELVKDPSKRRELMESVRLLASLGLRDRTYIRKKITQVEGDLDLNIEFCCDNCSHEWSAQLDPSEPGFFSPSEM